MVVWLRASHVPGGSCAVQAPDPVGLERGLQQAGSPQSQGSSPQGFTGRQCRGPEDPATLPKLGLGLDESCCMLDPWCKAVGKGMGLKGRAWGCG